MYNHVGWLSNLSEAPRVTLEALASHLACYRTERLENQEVFRTPEVMKVSGLAGLKALEKPADILRETKERMLAA